MAYVSESVINHVRRNVQWRKFASTTMYLEYRVSTSLTNGKFLGHFAPGSVSSREREGQGANGPGNERARERKFLGANWPGFYWPIRSGERMGLEAKRLWIEYNIGLATFVWRGDLSCKFQLWKFRNFVKGNSVLNETFENVSCTISEIYETFKVEICKPGGLSCWLFLQADDGSVKCCLHCARIRACPLQWNSLKRWP